MSMTIFRRIFNKRAQHITDRRLAPRNVAAIVKQGAARLGFDPSTFGGHSLRAGFVTSAVKRGANLIKITDVTGHRSLEVENLFKRRRGIRGSRQREIAVGNDMTHENQVAHEILSERSVETCKARGRPASRRIRLTVAMLAPRHLSRTR